MAGDVKAMTQVASPPVSAAAKEISGDVARKVRQTAKRTMDDVAMTPFLRKITFFSSGGSFLTDTCCRSSASHSLRSCRRSG